MIGRTLSAARFALTGNLRSWLTRGGVAAGAAVVLLGPVLSSRQGHGWTFDGELGALGFFMIAVFTIRSGLETHRETDLDLFLRHNFQGLPERIGGYLLSLLGSWITFAVLLFLLTLLCGEAPRDAAWVSGSWSARVLVVVGFVPVVEALMSLRLPLFLPAMIYTGFILVVTYALPPERVDPIVIPVSRGDFSAVGRLAVQAGLVFLVGAALFAAILSIQAALPRLLPRVLRGAGKIVPFDHGDAP